MLIFDEATSALDNKTELAVMEVLTSLDRELTVIMIAHRLTTLKGCDKIIKFEKNYETRIVSYKELMKLKTDIGDINVE